MKWSKGFSFSARSLTPEVALGLCFWCLNTRVFIKSSSNSTRARLGLACHKEKQPSQLGSETTIKQNLEKTIGILLNMS